MCTLVQHMRPETETVPSITSFLVRCSPRHLQSTEGIEQLRQVIKFVEWNAEVVREGSIPATPSYNLFLSALMRMIFRFLVERYEVDAEIETLRT